MRRPGAVSPGAMLVYRLPGDEEDETQMKPLEWGLIRRLFRFAQPVRSKVTALMILSVIRSLQFPALTWAVARIITGPITRHDTGVLPYWVAGYALLAVSTDLLFHFRQRYAMEIGETVVNGLRAELNRCIHRQPLGFFSRMKVGRLISRLTSDVESVRVGIRDVLFVSMIQVGQMVFAAAVMAYRDWHLFLVVLAMAPVLWGVNNHFRMKLSRLTRASQESFSRVTATLAESVSGIRVTQGFVRQDLNAGLFRSLLADHSRYNVELARTSGILTPLLELNSQFFVAILLMFGGWRVFHGSMSVGDLITFFFFANLFFAPITIVANQYNQALVAMAGAERVFRVLDMRPEWEDEPSARDLPVPPAGERRGMRVEFDAVSFAYEPGRRVLHDVAFAAQPGQSVALVGHTGSGKTSIVNLAAKFYLPSEGVVRIDGCDLRGITGRSLHRQMGIVTQQNFLFSGSVLDNIRYGRPEATEGQVREAAARLDCLDILEALPRGLLTEVGERGSGLSVGQRQLVCFARALLADPRLVILDEATSSIDALTEARLQRALEELLRDRTSLVIAHRLSTIRKADEVIVLDCGRIVERGTHARLLAAGGRYASLYRQFVQIDDKAQS